MVTTHTFTSDTTWTVPDGVPDVDIECRGQPGKSGDEGGNSAGGSGGAAGVAKGNLTVSGGDTLYIRFRGGGNGPYSGSTNGGGDGGNGAFVRLNGDTRSELVIAAGGGGGGGGGSNDYEDGGDGAAGGGTTGGDAFDITSGLYTTVAEGGGGGSQSSGGAGGESQDGNGSDGSAVSGGSGGETNEASAGEGGGGGGGYYGGGGGGSGAYDGRAYGGAGGGGGSNYLDSSLSSTTNTQGGNTGGQEVIISYESPPNPPQNVSPTVDADDQITLSWETDTSGTTPDDYDIEILRDGGSWVSLAGGGPSNVTADGSGSYSATFGPHNSGGSAKNYAGSVGIDSSFQFRVRANNSNGSSGWTSSDTVKTSPIPPKDVSVSRPDANTVQIHGTVQSDISSKIRVNIREDTGDGYGDWQHFDLVAEGDTDQLTSGSVQTKESDFTFTYETDTSYPGFSGTELKEDARYQFRLRTWNDPSGTDKKTSEWVYADYGNEGNVYFEDDFSSGDASAWDATSGSATVTSTLDSSFTAGDNTQSPEVGSYAVEMGGSGYVQKSLGDLSGESDVHVRLRVQAASNDSDSERGDLWWYDGSSWQTLEQWGWEHDGQGWMEYHATVPDSYLSTDNRVRIGRDEGGGVDYIAFDEIVVSDLLHEYTQPDAPSGLSIDASVEGEITASWTNNASFWTAFDTDYQRTSVSSWTDHSNVNGTSTTISGLADGEEYGVRTRVFRQQDRRGSYSQNLTSPFISAAAITVLPAPTNLSVDAVTATSVNLSWTDNHDYGQTEIQFKQSDASSWTTFSTLSRGTGAETVTGLLHGEQYDARAVATTEHTSTEDQ